VGKVNRNRAEPQEIEDRGKKKNPEWVNHFISTATHELRNPLTSIKGYLGLIKMRLETKHENLELDELRQMVDVVARNTERLENLINDTMEMYRLIEGRLLLNIAEHNVAEFLQHVSEDLAPTLEKRSQRLEVESDVESHVFDELRLVQVLRNLIQNSSKFSPDGSTIWLRVQKVDDTVRFSVTDEGVGLSPEDIPKLFKPFPKIKKPNYYEGTGLGLSICNGIVEAHGGELRAESPGLGRGSTFTFTIPDSSISE
jgi:signal transduction histidine kinase